MKTDSKSEELSKPEPAESFLIDIVNVKSTNMMRNLGCVFDRAEVVDEGTVKIMGHDGGGPGNEHTIVEILVRKGPAYKSPKELTNS
jgi:hypothetical protein